LGLPAEKLRFKDHEKLAHYAKAACDCEYLFKFGWGEVNGVHNRTNFDLSRHQEFSGKNMEYTDPTTNEKFIPYIVEASYGLDRITLALLDNAYEVETLENGEEREVMRFAPHLAPFKVAVLPLIKKLHADKTHELYRTLAKKFRVIYDETGSIGKRYRRQDAIGTPFCVTVDDETLNNGTVTVRFRDSMEQEVVKLDDLVSFIQTKVED
ncbi:MAG: glycine--tRNA ligase, partial [Clostridia bacterium]|nr:glycine--tRNA ligase [Clostridia bacterium]